MLRLVPRMAEETPGPLLEAGLPLPLARVLWARGVQTPEAANAFLTPSVADLHDPLRLRDMERAATRIRAALAAGEAIVIYGDYDVDGVCATSILVEALRAHGGNVTWYIPSRHTEGYGLNEQAVRTLSETTSLMITVDCGITSVAEAAVARELELDLIITDHHEPPERLPDALAVVDPLLGDYPFRRLCGAGVAFKLAQVLFGMDALDDLWELAALATVADLVPLLGENRILVSEGLRRMQHTKRPGLKALLAVSGLEGKVITAGHLGFQIGPRINAGGRLAEASRNVELLITRDERVAESIAAALNEENAARQRMEAAIYRQCEDWVLANVDFLTDRAMVVVGEGWNKGVVGLAASRLTERFAWPAIVLAEGEDGLLTGSARSVPGVNIHQALVQCEDLFERFGGHAQAAGMTLKGEHLPAFRERLNAAIAAIAEPDAFIPSASYDLNMELESITIPLIEQLERLAPTGFGNPSPVFRLTGAQVLEARGVGNEGRHLKLRLAQGNTALDGIAFGLGSLRAGLPEKVDALFSPTINEYMGRRSAQCEVQRIVPHQAADAFAEECHRRADDFDCHALEHAQRPAKAENEAVRRALVEQALARSHQGTLLTVRTLRGLTRCIAWLKEAGLDGRLDYVFGKPEDVRRFNTLCALPVGEAGNGYENVFALDDDLVAETVQEWMPADDALRGLYRTLRAGAGRFASERSLAEAAGLRVAAVRLGLRAFAELELVDYQPVPFQAVLLPPKKTDLQNSGTLCAFKEAFMWEENA